MSTLLEPPLLHDSTSQTWTMAPAITAHKKSPVRLRQVPNAAARSQDQVGARTVTSRPFLGESLLPSSLASTWQPAISLVPFQVFLPRRVNQPTKTFHSARGRVRHVRAFAAASTRAAPLSTTLRHPVSARAPNGISGLEHRSRPRARRRARQ